MSINDHFKELWKNLDSQVEANLQFARYVMNQEPINTRYFFGDYSYQIVKWIAITVFSANSKSASDVICQIYGDYYEFVSNPIDDLNNPHWYQLKSYKGINNKKLKSWLMENAHQYFARKKNRYNKRKNAERELLEFIDYETLLGIGDCPEELSDEETFYRKRIRNAWSSLSEKDKNVLYYLILEKLNWKDAFEELNEYINPRKGRQVIEEWTDKRKQDALAMMKARALLHLNNRFNQKKTNV